MIEKELKEYSNLIINKRRLEAQLEELEQEKEKFAKGSLQKKTIKNKVYVYLAYRDKNDNNKVKTTYIAKENDVKVDKLRAELTMRNQIDEVLKMLKLEYKEMCKVSVEAVLLASVTQIYAEICTQSRSFDELLLHCTTKHARYCSSKLDELKKVVDNINVIFKELEKIEDISSVSEVIADKFEEIANIKRNVNLALMHFKLDISKKEKQEDEARLADVREHRRMNAMSYDRY